jgi:hypothetical protein
MEPLQAAVLLANRNHRWRAWSALPDAPTLAPAPTSLRVARTRAALAGALHRAAEVVAPTPPLSPCVTGPAH